MNIKIASLSNQIFDSIVEKYAVEDSFAILMSHCGVFSQDLVNSLGEGVEELLIAANEKKPMIRRIFSILIEGLQNIRIHGALDLNEVKTGILVFAKGEGSYKISFGNIISNDTIDALENRLTELNNLNEVELKNLCMHVLSAGILSNKGGAGLGFITMKIKAKSDIRYHFYTINDSISMFTFELTIKREI